MCVCVCVCAGIGVCVCMCMCVCVCRYRSLCVCVYVCVCAGIGEYVHYVSRYNRPCRLPCDHVHGTSGPPDESSPKITGKGGQWDTR